MSKFSVDQGAGGGQSPSESETVEYAVAKPWSDSSGAAGSVTLTADQMINGSYRVTSGSTSAVTTAAAADIVAGLAGAEVGSSFDFVFQNGGSGTATFTAGTGVTLKGVVTSPLTHTTHWFKGRVTNATKGSEAVDLISLFYVGA